MEKISEMIKLLCPQNINWVRLENLCQTITPPFKLKTNQYLEDGQYIVIDQGQNYSAGYTNIEEALLPEGEYVLYGDHTCSVKYINKRFAQGADGLKILKTKESCKAKYLYYALLTHNLQNTEYKRHWTQAKEILIPLPSLSIQQEFVRILDSFTSMITNLETELASRQKQYEYYRNKLLTFDKDDESVEWKTLGEISIKVCSGGTPNRSRKDYFCGKIPWLRTQEVNWNEVFDTEIKISEEAFSKSSAKLIPKNCVIIAMYGATAGKSCINKIPLTTNQACCNLQVNPKLANYKYVYFYVCNEYENIKDMGEGSQNNINAQKIKSYNIPIPSLSRQQEIVSTLDTFESLITNIKHELEARKKQYEYYREQLLTFRPSPTLP